VITVIIVVIIIHGAGRVMQKRVKMRNYGVSRWYALYPLDEIHGGMSFYHPRDRLRNGVSVLASVGLT